MFRVTEIPSKGKGVVAQQAIPAGTLLLSEPPIALVPRYTLVDKYTSAVLPQLQKISDTQKKGFFDLDNNYKHLRPIEGIIKTNAIPLGHTTCKGAIFLKCSRFNHSCVANAAYHWNQNIGEERIYTVRDISVDEEVTVNYIPTDMWYLPGKERRAEILESFGFECRCIQCEKSDQAESDARRKRLCDINRTVGDGQLIITNPNKALALCREALDLLKQEEGGGALTETVYYDAFQICVCHGDIARAAAFATLALKAKIAWQGQHAPEREETEALQRKPESHRLAFHTRRWASSKKSSAASLQNLPDEEWLWQRAK